MLLNEFVVEVKCPNVCHPCYAFFSVFLSKTSLSFIIPLITLSVGQKGVRFKMDKGLAHGKCPNSSPNYDLSLLASFSKQLRSCRWTRNSQGGNDSHLYINTDKTITPTFLSNRSCWQIVLNKRPYIPIAKPGW